jgi:hypothetical protein
LPFSMESPLFRSASTWTVVEVLPGGLAVLYLYCAQRSRSLDTDVPRGREPAAQS